MLPRYDFRTHPCPKCGAPVGSACISAAGRSLQRGYEHVARLRVRHDWNGRPRDPASILPNYAYPKRPNAIGVVVLSPVGVHILAALVPGR